MSEVHGASVVQSTVGDPLVRKPFQGPWGNPVASCKDGHIRPAALCEPNQTSIDVAHTRQLQDGKFPAQPPREKVTPVVEGDEVVTQRPYRPFNILGHCDEMWVVIPADQYSHVRSLGLLSEKRRRGRQQSPAADEGKESRVEGIQNQPV